jgi:hypothetical protein
LEHGGQIQEGDVKQLSEFMTGYNTRAEEGLKVLQALQAKQGLKGCQFSAGALMLQHVNGQLSVVDAGNGQPVDPKCLMTPFTSAMYGIAKKGAVVAANRVGSGLMSYSYLGGPMGWIVWAAGSTLYTSSYLVPGLFPVFESVFDAINQGCVEGPTSNNFLCDLNALLQQIVCVANGASCTNKASVASYVDPRELIPLMASSTFATIVQEMYNWDEETMANIKQDESWFNTITTKTKQAWGVLANADPEVYKTLAFGSTSISTVRKQADAVMDKYSQMSSTEALENWKEYGLLYSTTLVKVAPGASDTLKQLWNYCLWIGCWMMKNTVLDSGEGMAAFVVKNWCEVNS